MFTSDSPILLHQIGPLAITTNSLPSLLAIPLYVSVCFWLTAKNGLLFWKDLRLLLIIASTQIVLMPWAAGPNPAFSVFILSWPIMAFMIAYGVWRLAGNKPLQDWPWYRYGLITTLLLLLVDIASGFMFSPGPGKIWQLGGAGLLDTLVCAPPVFILTFHLFLDCRSSLVFCSKGCRTANRCLFHIARAAPTKPEFTYPFWKRTLLSATCAILVLLAFPALTDTWENITSPLAPELAQYISPFVNQMSKNYGITPPNVMQSNMNTFALTLQENNGKEVTIYLGETYFKSKLLNDPEATQAMIAHEFGHAVLFSRNQSYPKLLILFAYFLTLTVIIYAMPSPTGTMVYALILLTTFVLLVGLTGLTVHRAFQTIVLGVTALGVFWAITTPNYIKAIFGNSHTLPRRYTFFNSGCITMIITYLGFAAIGTINTSYELFADQVAACSVGPDQVVKLLKTIDPRSTSNELIATLTDPFHPTIQKRLEVLKGHHQGSCFNSSPP